MIYALAPAQRAPNCKYMCPPPSAHPLPSGAGEVRSAALTVKIFDLHHIPSGAPGEVFPSKGREALTVNIYDYSLSSDPLPSVTLERCKPPTRRARSCKDYSRTYVLLYAPYPVVPLRRYGYMPPNAKSP
jgi:hypothetical protein